ncbi:MAG: hypothetical protein AAGA80_26895 [Cyanobacteria bacterium P01_F01_bin.143]
MNTEDIEDELEQSETTPDTPLPQELTEHLEERKKHRLQVIRTTELVQKYFISWSLSITGFFLARLLLLINGGASLWLAAGLCFSVCSITSVIGLSGFRANYNDGLEVEGMDKPLRTIGGFVVAAGTTWLAIKDYQYFQQITYDTAHQISADIQTIYQKRPWLDPWLSIGIAAAILISSLFLISKR